MTPRPRPGSYLLASALGLMIPLSGCTGSSDDKGDNGGSIITPKPTKVEDANTAGSSKSVLPDPDTKAADAKSADPSPK